MKTQSVAMLTLDLIRVFPETGSFSSLTERCSKRASKVFVAIARDYEKVMRRIDVQQKKSNLAEEIRSSRELEWTASSTSRFEFKKLRMRRVYLRRHHGNSSHRLQPWSAEYGGAAIANVIQLAHRQFDELLIDQGNWHFAPIRPAGQHNGHQWRDDSSREPGDTVAGTQHDHKERVQDLYAKATDSESRTD